MSYNVCMISKVYISKSAYGVVKDYIEAMGHQLVVIHGQNSMLPKAISCHSDIYLCKIGTDADSYVFHGDSKAPVAGYPSEAIFNASVTDNYFLHKLSITSPSLLEVARDIGKTLIDVPQGYTRCNALPLPGDRIITQDAGIYKRTKDFLSTLLIEPSPVLLPGYKNGFLPGCCGRVDDKIVFNGDLSRHNSFMEIIDFIDECGLEPVWFPELPLLDIGSIIQEVLP